jgi:large subunit ribosomal protein L17
MFRNLAANLITHERIVTTDAKAKELRRVTERLITKAKRLKEIAYTPHDQLSAQDRAKRLHVKRQLLAYLPRWGVERDGLTRRDLIEKVMVYLSQRFAKRPGGYTRITKIGPRHGDNAPMSAIEFVDAPPVDETDAAPAPAAEPEAEAEAPAPEAEATDESSEPSDDDK